MKILPVILLFLAFSTNISAQTKTFTDSAIADTLYKESVKIGVKLFEAVNSGKIKAYRTDSLDKTISAEDWKNLNWNAAMINGLSVQFITTSPVESDLQSMKLAGIAPMYNPSIAGIELPQQNMFFVKLTDFDKVVTKEDKKLVHILSKLLFSTHNFHHDFNIGDNEERQKQDINNFLSNTINDNLNRSIQYVYFTKENIGLLSQEILHKTAVYFEQMIYYKHNGPEYILINVREDNKLKDVFEDAELKKPYNKALWQKSTGFCETVSLQDPMDPNIIVDSTVCTMYDFYSANKIILSSTAIGMGTDFSAEFSGNKVRFYTSRKNLSGLMPTWLTFLFDTYLD